AECTRARNLDVHPEVQWSTLFRPDGSHKVLTAPYVSYLLFATHPAIHIRPARITLLCFLKSLLRVQATIRTRRGPLPLYWNLCIWRFFLIFFVRLVLSRWQTNRNWEFNPNLVQ